MSLGLLSSPKSGGPRGLKASLEADLMRTRVVGSGGHSPPYGWIPAPRSHEDKLRGNDGRECRDSSLPGVWECPPPP